MPTLPLRRRPCGVTVRTLLAALPLLTASGIAQRAPLSTPGYDVLTLELPPAAIQALVVEDLDGAVYFEDRDVYWVDFTTPSVPVSVLSVAQPRYGNLLCEGPDRTVLFYEAGVHLWQIALPGSARTTRRITSTPDLYDAIAWDPNTLIVSQHDRRVPGRNAKVLSLDLATGALDELFTAPEYGGPLGRSGSDVYYATNGGAFTFPRVPTTVYRFDDATLRSALGPTVLRAATSGQVVATGPLTPAHLVCDDDGEVYLCEYLGQTLFRVRDGLAVPFATGLGRIELAQTARGFGGRGAFEPFQPKGDRRLVLTTAFVFDKHLRVIEPARPRLATTPPTGPIPPGPFALDIWSAAPGGYAVVLFGPPPQGPEAILGIPGFRQSLFLDPGMSLGTGLSIPTRLNVSGDATVVLTNPGFAPALDLGAQVVFVDESGATTVGSTPAITVQLR